MTYIPADPARERLHDGYIDVVNRDGYNHLGYFSPLNSSIPDYITGGNWEVTGGLAGFDKDTNAVYFPLPAYLTAVTSRVPRNPLLKDTCTVSLFLAKISNPSPTSKKMATTKSPSHPNQNIINYPHKVLVYPPNPSIPPQ